MLQLMVDCTKKPMKDIIKIVNFNYEYYFLLGEKLELINELSFGIEYKNIV